MEWQMERLNPKAVVEDAVAATGGLFEERGIRLDVQLPLRLPMVYADRDRLMQVLVNLISNAANYCDEANGRVVVWGSARQDQVTIGVRDNGPGIPKAAQKQIFERFQQADAPRKGRTGGTGLGLTICRQIVEHFGGTIGVESRPGEGAQFAISLPTAAALERGGAVEGRRHAISRLIPAAGKRLGLKKKEIPAE